MVFEVVWHPSASIDLEGEIEYVCQQFGWDASKKCYEEVMERIGLLSSFPYLGVLFEGIAYHGNEVRMFYFRQNTIVYSIANDQITIIAFWNNRQDPLRLEKTIGSR